MRYYIQHGAGLGALVIAALKSDFPDVKVSYQDDSSLVIETPPMDRQIVKLSYVKNSFRVVASVSRGSLIGSVQHLTKLMEKSRSLENEPRGRTFRVMAHVDGELVGLPQDTRSRLVSVIARHTAGHFNPRGGLGAEYWVIGRRESDVLMFGVRLTMASKKGVARGALASDLSTLLVKASDPQSSDVFLDPFAGSGALVAARIQTPFTRAIYSDIRLGELRSALPGSLLRRNDISVLNENALTLSSISTGEIDSIVTDPPWGEYEDLGIPYDEFASRMVKSLDRVLDARHGRLVMLLSRRTAPAVASRLERAQIHLRESHNILLNGHPATVVVGTR